MVEIRLEPPQDHIHRIDDAIYPCRVYECQGKVYPSVTSVLSVGDSPDWYEAWVDRVGAQKAEAITRVAGDRGTIIHAACQDFVCTGNIDLVKPMMMPDDLYRFVLIKKELSKLGLVRAVEYKQSPGNIDLVKPMMMPDDLYRFVLIKKELSKLGLVRAVEYKQICKQYAVAGTADLIAYYNGLLTVFDYKSSNKPKQEESFQSFWMQTAFYALAWNEEHPDELVTQLGIIPVNDQEMFIKPRFLPLNYVKSNDLADIRAEFKKRYKF